jgi:hypothetical protein
MAQSQAPVAHTYNPSYSWGRDQENRSFKPAQTNSSWDPISKKLLLKRAGWVPQGVAQSSSPSTRQKERMPHKHQNKIRLHLTFSMQKILNIRDIPIKVRSKTRVPSIILTI